MHKYQKIVDHSENRKVQNGNLENYGLQRRSFAVVRRKREG